MTNAFSELLDDMEDRERLIDAATRTVANADDNPGRLQWWENHLLLHRCNDCLNVVAKAIRQEYRRLLAERAQAWPRADYGMGGKPL